jgi:hypothetical protein
VTGGMSPEDLAKRHPRLYHLTAPSALEGIKRHGLLSTNELLTLFEASEAKRYIIANKRRPKSETLDHPEYGRATISDNAPLSERKLAKCLDDNLTVSDWLNILNSRVFFWADKGRLNTHLNARLNRGHERLVLVFDTLRLAQRNGPRIELSPINTGATAYNPTRRGLSTFVPLARHSYAEWQKPRQYQRKTPDKIVEVTITGAVVNVSCLLVDHYIAVGTSKRRVEPPPG